MCPPYDVISDQERAALVSKSRYNAVRLELPRPDGQGDPYAAAAALLDAWRDGGVLHRDATPAFYGYRMSYEAGPGRSEQTVGVIGALGLEAPGAGILPHEETTPKAKSDRLELLRATRTNLSPIWGLSTAAGLAAALDAPSRPAGRAQDPDGVLHEFWAITAEHRVRAISEMVASQPVLIADGHHRYETALAYHRAQSADTPPAPSGSGSIMALVVPLADDQLAVRPIHRLLSGLPGGMDVEELFGEAFELTPDDVRGVPSSERLRQQGAMAIVTAERAWLAVAKPATQEMATHDLDSSRLDAVLATFPPHKLSYQHGWESALAAVHTGQAQVAVLVRPASVRQIAEIARGGVRMPAKTTFFWPKPRTGMVMRELL